MTKQEQILALAQLPNEGIVKHLSVGKKDYDFIPIHLLENELDRIFGVDMWDFELNTVFESISGAAVVGGHLVVTFTDGSVKRIAGVGAAQIADGAGGMAFPKAKSDAIKNAAFELGNALGRSLRRSEDFNGKESKYVSDVSNYSQAMKGYEKSLKYIESATPEQLELFMNSSKGTTLMKKSIIQMAVAKRRAELAEVKDGN